MVPGELYVIPDDVAEGGDGERWIQPRSVDEIVVDAIREATDLDAEDLDPLEEYVEYESLVALFGDETEEETVSFAVEDYDVTVYASGTVEVVESE